MYRKAPGAKAKLCYQGHVLMENRHGLAVDGCLTPANGYGERAAALAMIGPLGGEPSGDLGRRQSLRHARLRRGPARLLQVTPHVAQNTANRSSAIDERTTRHAGYEVSQQKRKRIEEIFGWGKDGRPMRKMKARTGKSRASWPGSPSAATPCCGSRG